MNEKEVIRKGNTRLRIIFGQAGSGKSTELINMINEDKDIKPIVLCSKWMLVRTMKDRLKENGIECRVNTIQSITNNVDNAPFILSGVDTIIVDEFSQVDYNQLLSLIDSAEKLGITEMIAAGDFLQNEPIGGGSYSPMRHIVRQYLLGKTSNFFASLVKQPIYEMMKNDNIKNIDVPESLVTIFNKIEINVLTENWRQNGAINIRGYSDIKSLLSNNYEDSKKNSKIYDKLKNAILSRDWQIIVADWHQMNLINVFAEDNELSKDGNNESQFYVDARGFSDVNYRKYYKKVNGKFKIVNGRDRDIDINTMMYIRPTYAIVADSAQGMEFENVLLFSMLDKDVKLGTKFNSWSNFSFNTLYMAATRHKNIVDICVDKNGWKDMKNALDILPKARKDMLKEEWLEYCLINAPEPILGYEEYRKRSHFNKDKNTGKIYSKIGNDNKIDVRGTEIRFSGNAKEEIELYSKLEFMRRWNMKREENEYVSNFISEQYSRNKIKRKPSKAEQFILDTGKDNINFDLTVRNFKSEYNVNKRHVINALETYEQWL